MLIAARDLNAAKNGVVDVVAWERQELRLASCVSPEVWVYAALSGRHPVAAIGVAQRTP